MKDTTIVREKAPSSPMRMGIMLFLISETFLFGALFWTYYYLRGHNANWPPQHPLATLPAINTGLLLLSSIAVWLGGFMIKKGREKGLFIGLLTTVLLGASFLGITGWEWLHESFRPWTNAYGSIFFLLTGVHALHVFGGVLLMLALLARTARHRFTAGNALGVEIGSLYWHFIDLIWLLVFTTIFIVH